MGHLTRDVYPPWGMEATPSPTFLTINYSDEREARAIFPFPLRKAGVQGFLPWKIFKIADARTWVLIHFNHQNYLLIVRLLRINFFWSMGQKLQAFIFRACFNWSIKWMDWIVASEASRKKIAGNLNLAVFFVFSWDTFNLKLSSLSKIDDSI